MFTTSFSAPGAGNPTKENEDWIAVTSDLVVVLDGATVRTDTGCHHGVSWYTRKLGAAVIDAAASRSRTLQGSLSDAIQEVANLHSSECDLSHPGTPSAAVAIARFEGDSVNYLVLGDTPIVFETQDYGIKSITDDRVSKTAANERASADRYAIGTPEKSAAMVEMKKAELAARNVPGGYWIAATDPAAVDHAIVGSAPLRDITRIAVMTDGAARSVELFKTHSWNRLLDVLQLQGPHALVHSVRTSEESDPLGQAFPRNKKSDDASIVFIDPHRTPTGWTGMTPGRSVNSEVDFWSDRVQESRAKTISQYAKLTRLPGLMGEAPRSMRSDTPTKGSAQTSG